MALEGITQNWWGIQSLILSSTNIFWDISFAKKKKKKKKLFYQAIIPKTIDNIYKKTETKPFYKMREWILLEVDYYMYKLYQRWKAK